MKTRTPLSADVYAGKILKKKRNEMGLSQGKLGRSIGVTFQQIQKYESGINRISISTLSAICSVLHIEPNRFFQFW